MYGGHHRATLSLATSVDLDVEGGGRLDEDYDGGWSSSHTLAWSAKGPAAYTSTMGVVQSIKCHLTWAKIGIIDANRWQEAFNVAMRSADIRNGILKGFLLSASITLLIFFFELAFFPAHLFPGSSSAAKYDDTFEDFEDAGRIGGVFWLYPLIAGSYFLASSWTVDVAKAAHQLKHGRMMSSAIASPAFPPGTQRRVLVESYRVLLVVNYVIICLALQQIPYAGRVLSFLFMSFIDSYYCFEQGWIARGWSVERRMRYAESRWAYFVAFGLPSTAVSFFHPSGLLNLMLFMLIFPVCTVLAMLASPQPRQAPTASASLTPSNSGLPPALANNKALSAFLPPRIPVFWLTVKSYRFILRLFPRVLEGSSAAQTQQAPATGNAAGWRNARQFANPALFAAGGSNGPQSQSQTPYANADQSSHTFGSAAYGSGINRGTDFSTAGKRGATAAQFVDGAWGGQGLGVGSGLRSNDTYAPSNGIYSKGPSTLQTYAGSDVGQPLTSGASGGAWTNGQNTPGATTSVSPSFGLGGEGRSYARAGGKKKE